MVYDNTVVEVEANGLFCHYLQALMIAIITANIAFLDRMTKLF